MSVLQLHVVILRQAVIFVQLLYNNFEHMLFTFYDLITYSIAMQQFIRTYKYIAINSIWHMKHEIIRWISLSYP